MTEAISAALLDKLATEHEHPLKPKEMPPNSVADGAVPWSSSGMPLRNVPGWRARWFSPVLWSAPKRIRKPGAGARALDTAMETRHVRGIVVTVYLALNLKDGDDFFLRLFGREDLSSRR